MSQFNSAEKILLFIIFILVILRLANLALFPIFGDEALHLYLAEKITENPANLFDMIKFGVFPLDIWTLSILRFFFNGFNYFIAGRLLQVSWDLLATFVVYLIGNRISNRTTGLISSLIYLLLPLNFLHSRLILLEPLTNLLVILAIYFVIKYLDQKQLNYFPNLKFILLISLILFLAFFVKALAVVSFIPLLFLPLFFYFQNEFKNLKVLIKQYDNLALTFGTAGIFILLFYLPISADFSKYISQSNFTILQTILHLKANLYKSFWWFSSYLTLPIIITFVFASAYFVYKKEFKLLWFSFWFICVLLISSIFSANYYPRHLYCLAIPTSIVLGFGLNKILQINKKLFFVILILISLPSIYFIQRLIINPSIAPLALEDRQQLLEDWTAGTGNAQIAAKINQQAQIQPITVLTESDPTQYWEFASLYQVKAQLIPSSGVSEDNLQAISQQSRRIGSKPIFIIANRNPDLPKNWPVSLIYRVPKGPNRSINLYQLNSF